jgi:inosine/xanthosine triphosphatase
MYIFVGSSNPVKIDAVKTATMQSWPHAVIASVEVASGVPVQPMGDDQTRLGARNRAVGALEFGLKNVSPIADRINADRINSNHISPELIGIGLEGGVFQNDGELWDTVWVAVADSTGRVVDANGSRFKIPTQIAEPILAGQEMGDVVASLSRIENLKQKQGMMGLVTNNFLTRSEAYSAIAKMAIGLWFGQFKPWQKIKS